jgi:Rogdi leucine zipper containing protein
LPLSEVRQQALRRSPIYTQILSEALNIFTSNFAIRSLQDIHLRFATLPPNTARTQTNSTPSTRITINPSTPGSDLILSQLVSVKALINDSLDIIDVSRWTGQSTDASFISGQLKLLHEHLGEARACLKGPVPGQGHASGIPGGEWWTSSAAEDVFEPPLPPHLSLHFTIQDANLVLIIRTLAPISASGTPSTPTADLPFSLSGFNLRSRLLGLGTRLPTHDEMGEVFQWRGREEVTVREKLRVESGDPSLMSVAAKLSALEHEVGRWRMNVRIVMGQSGDDEDE